jgi:hypothetical protein
VDLKNSIWQKIVNFVFFRMLHYYGDQMAIELGQAAKFYIQLYLKKDLKDVCFVPFIDLRKDKQRYVKFQLLADQWCFVDVVD